MDQDQLIHPEIDQLKAFSLGKLTPEEIDRIEHHLAECSPCCDTLTGLKGDTFTDLVQEAGQDTQVEAASASDTAGAPQGSEQATLPPRDASAAELGTDFGTDDSQEATAVEGTRLLAGGAEVPAELAAHARYRVLELLGTGGMGAVYKAEHRLMQRVVALKVINPSLTQNATAVERFQREVRAAARLNHPNIVTAHDAESAGGLHLMVMEYVEGTDLADVLEARGPLPVDEACNYIRQAALGLQHACEQGMVHRDIKPQNLMLTSAPQKPGFSEKPGFSPDRQVKILDFGLAHFASEVGTRSGLTEAGSIMGTPDYMAPEQARDARKADIRADIYSLGCTLYCLLTGEVPFPEGSVIEKVMAHTERDPRPITDFRDDVPPELESVLRRMMAKAPADRYQTPEDVAAALGPFADGVTPAGDTSRPRTQPAAAGTDRRLVRRGRSSSRRGWIIAALAATAGLLLLGAVITIVTARGRVVIQSQVGDVKVIVRQGGEEIAVIDTQTGSQVAWVPMGDVELQLVGNDNSVKLDRTSFEMTRLGTVIVTARWETAELSTIRSFKPTDETITRDGIEVDEGGWKITATGTRTVRLFEVSMPKLQSGPYFYRAKLKSENVKGRAYLEMWSRFPGEGEYFSKGFDKAITGTNGWAEYEIPFFLQQGQQPDLVKLNVVIEGGGTVWIKDVELRGRTVTEFADVGEFTKWGNWQSLFNGRDLSGWKTHPDQPTGWKVENGVLIGRGDGVSHLFTERGDFEDFHLRAEVNINRTGNSGIFFRCGDDLTRGRFPTGYEAHILNGTQLFRDGNSEKQKTGSLYGLRRYENRLVQPDEWFTLEVIAVRNRITIKVNGLVTTDYVDTDRLYQSGHVALQKLSHSEPRPQPTVVQFRKIEVREPAREPSGQSAALTPHERLQGRWIAVSGHMRDKPLTDEQLAQLSFTFDGPRVEIHHPDLDGAPMRGTFEIDEKRQPMFIDFTALDGSETSPGIFAFEGERLKLAMIDEDYARPSDFSPSGAPDHLTATFERGPAAGGLIGPEERKVLQAVEEYLAVLDEGRFGELHGMLAGFAKQNTPRAAFSRSMQGMRDLFGKVEQRTLHRVQIMSQFPNLPPGRYAGVQYKSNFEQRDGLWESLLLSVEPDGTWRVNTYANTLQPLPFPEEDPEADEKKEAGMTAAREWLKLVDAGKYGEAWEACAEYARNADDKESLIRGYTKLFKPLGELKSRDLKGSTHTTQMPNVPRGDYVVIQFHTQFDNRRVQETVVLMKEKDGKWRVSGYFHAPLESTMTPTPPPDKADTGSKPPKAEEEAAKALQAWLKLIDEGKYGESWDAFPEDVRQVSTRAEWEEGLRKVREPQGAVKSRKLDGRTYANSLPDLGPGHYVTFEYRTTFAEGGEAMETVLMSFENGTWKPRGYVVTPAPGRPTGVNVTPAPGVPTGVNLITDPSLENTAVGRLPRNWSRYIDTDEEYQYGVVAGGRTGKKSLMLSGKGTRIHAFAGGVPLDRTKRYVLRGWVRYEGDVDGSATIKFNYRKGETNYYLGDGDSISIGRAGWQFLTKTDRADEAPEADMLWVSCKLEGNGKAYFDDLELIAYDRKNLPADFEEKHGRHNRLTGGLDFNRWVGRWETTTEYKPTRRDEGRIIKGDVIVRKVLDDRYLLWQWSSEARDSQYLSLLALDKHVGGYHFWVFGSGGEAYERTGQWDAAAQSLNLRVNPPSPGITGRSTDRFVNDDRIESTLLVKSPDGEVTRDMRATWVRKSKTVEQDIHLADGPVAGLSELALLEKMAGQWTIASTQKPSVPEPEGKTETFTESVDWTIGGRFLLFRAYDDNKELTSLSLMTWEPKENSYRFWYFAPDVFGGQWRITWDASSRSFHWRAIDMPAGWIGTGFNRWIDDDTFDNQALIKDEQGRIMLDVQQKKRRVKE